ncbi:MAG: CBS domain-containing protein [Candidatus Krumholzibacteria bacterium]|nr:CBS domain-containing protein [Candidatus Krumholzibacteria bacterium]
MNTLVANNKNGVEHIYSLTDIIGYRIMLHGKRIGKLADLVVVEHIKLPEVTNVVIARPFGHPSIIVPFEKVLSIEPKQVTIDIEAEEPYVRELRSEEILLKDHVLDKKVVDIEGREVEIVYDIRLVKRAGKLFVTDVDLSKYGLLRRIGLKRLANFIYSLADKIKEQTVSWAYIQPLPPTISLFKGDVKLNILKEKLSDMHPVDLADILEELDREQRVAIFDGLDTEHASDTLEEIDPNVQRDLVFSLTKERVAELIDEMTPGQGADILSVLAWEDVATIMKMLSPENASKIESILKKQDENILNFTTQEFLKLPPGMTADEVEDGFRGLARGKDVIMYLYVVDEQDKLLGVIDIKELLMAKDSDRLGDIMTETIISLNPDNTLKEASAMFARYGFRAIPVTDENGRILGVIHYRDMMNLNHRFLG